MQIRFENVSYIYQANSPLAAKAMENISLDIDTGDFLALIGHTGSGKSTLVQHINGLLAPTSGRVLADGQDINAKGYSKRALRQKIGMVFQYPEQQLFEESVAKDVAFGPKNLGLSEAEIAERVPEALRRVGLSPDLAEKSPFELSGGQMRRVALAGVLAMRPEMLVLDEPAAGLDPQSRQDMLALIADLHASGTTIVMVSHAMDDVAQYATRCAVMSGGKLVLTGTPGEVFSHAEEMEALRLDIPTAARLGLLLRRRGIDFPAVYRAEDAEKALLALWKEAHHAG